jgi:hypothetical protein
VYLLPLSGLFMCVIYPTINSAGISCVPKSEHGAIAGTFYFSHAFRRSWARLQWAQCSDATGESKHRVVLAAPVRRAVVFWVAVQLNSLPHEFTSGTFGSHRI